MTMGDFKTLDIGQLDRESIELDSELQICQKQIEESESKLGLLEPSTDLNSNVMPTSDGKHSEDAAYLKEKLLLLRQKEVELRRERFQLNQIKMGFVERFQVDSDYMDKVVLITGSTSGIGLEIAKKFAELRAKVVINGFGSQEMIDEACQSVKSAGASGLLYSAADLSKPAEIADMYEQILKQFGKVDILVNNAGIQHVCPIDEFPDDKWEHLIRINLIACFYTIKYALPSMKKSNWGRIINVASAHGLVGSPYKSAYVSAKHGLIGLTKSVSLEVAEQGICVNSICPGYVKTPLVANQIADMAKVRGMSEEEVVRNVILNSHANKKFVDTNEISSLVLYLCSNNAASITGASISIDGGWTSS